MDRSQKLINAFVSETTEFACIYIRQYLYYYNYGHHDIQHLVLMAYQLFLDYFTPRDKGIASILRVFSLSCVVVSQEVFAHSNMVSSIPI